MQDIVNNNYIGPFRVGTVYYFMFAPISDFTKNPRPDIKLIHYIEELAPYYIDSLGFSKLYPQFWFDINTLEDSKSPYQSISSMTILHFDENLRIPSYKILGTTENTYSMNSRQAEMYNIDSIGKVTAEKYKDFFCGYLLETIEVTKYEVGNLMHNLRIVKEN
jgi:hypothetical protein